MKTGTNEIKEQVDLSIKAISDSIKNDKYAIVGIYNSLTTISEIDKTKLEFIEENKEYFEFRKKEIIIRATLFLRSLELANNYENDITGNLLEKYIYFLNIHFEKLIDFISLKYDYYLRTNEYLELKDFIMTINFWELYIHWKYDDQKDYDSLLLNTQSNQLDKAIIKALQETKTDIDKSEAINKDSQNRILELLKKLEELKNKGKQPLEPYPEYKNNHKPNSWEDVTITLGGYKQRNIDFIDDNGEPKTKKQEIFDSEIITYQTTKGNFSIKIFDNAKVRKTFFTTAVKYRDKPLRKNLERKQSTMLTKINSKLKDKFNKEISPIIWNRTQKSYKILFNCKILNNERKEKTTLPGNVVK